MAINPYSFAAPVRRFFRRRRFAGFRERYGHCKTIADIGGDPGMWTNFLGRSEGVIILNNSITYTCNGFKYLLADGCQLPIADKSVDLAFSNSTIEHVGSYERQRRFGAELMRIGKAIYCQTPSRLFPIDPHLGTPFWHWLPRRCLTPAFLRYCTLNGWLLGKAITTTSLGSRRSNCGQFFRDVR